MINLSDWELKIVNQVNEYRTSQYLTPLQYEDAISAIARSHSQALANIRNANLQKNKIHFVVNHKKFNERFKEICKVFPSTIVVGENVAGNLNYIKPEISVVEGWIESPEHEENMVGDFTKTGVGIARSLDGAYFFTQLFSK